MEFPDFNNLEEVKEFISSTDSKNVGAIHFIDQNGESVTMSMNEFIEKVGLDNAAKFIYENNDKMQKIAMTGKDVKELLEKARNNPDSLSEEEQKKLILAIHEMNRGGINTINTYDEIITIILKSFLEVDSTLTEKYDAVLAICITLLDGLLVLSSDKLSVYADNMNMYREIIRTIEEQITIPEGIDDILLLATLINIIGRRYLENKTDLNSLKCNYRDFAKAINLDTDFLFENDNNPFKEEIISDIKNDNNKIPLTKDKNSSIVNLDIRKKLKEDKM